MELGNDDRERLMKLLEFEMKEEFTNNPVTQCRHGSCWVQNPEGEGEMVHNSVVPLLAILIATLFVVVDAVPVARVPQRVSIAASDSVGDGGPDVGCLGSPTSVVVPPSHPL